MNAFFKLPLTIPIAPIAMLLCYGCAAHFQLPMTSYQLAQQHSVPALVAYLGQADANAAVCESGHEAAQLREDGDLIPALVDALRDDPEDARATKQVIAEVLSDQLRT